jgi:uncharacterized membrane protein YfcA
MVLTLQSFAALAGHSQHVSIDLHLASIIVGGTVCGSLIGGLLTGFVNATVLRRLFGLLVIAVASYLVYREANAALFRHIREQLTPELLRQAGTQVFWVWVTMGILGVLGVFGLGIWLHSPARPAARHRPQRRAAARYRARKAIR